MKFDKRNPFSAWGFEQEVYTTSGENETVAFEEGMAGFQTMKNMEDSAFVNDAAINERAGEFRYEDDAQQVFFTNNENMAETVQRHRRMVDGKDIAQYIEGKESTGEELPMYGIHADDWKLYGEASAEESTEESTDESTSSDETTAEPAPEPEPEVGIVTE